MAGVLRRIFDRNKLDVPAKKPFLGLSVSTLASYMDRTARLEKDGWEFSHTVFHPSHPEYHIKKFTMKPARKVPSRWRDEAFSIKHMESGIAFRFCPYDAYRKWREEKKTKDPLASKFPSYASPLLPLHPDQYDSAYLGRVVIEKPGEVAQNPHLKWEEVDQNALDEQIVWTTKSKSVPDCLETEIDYDADGLAYFSNTRKYPKSKLKGLADPLLKFSFPCYKFGIEDFGRTGGTSLELFMVVTEFGWFSYLHQLFYNLQGTKRVREMTMHCAFKQNVIYREITERQSNGLFKRPNKVNKDLDPAMVVVFHEVKKLQMLETNLQGVSDSKQNGPISPGERVLVKLPFADGMIESLVATGKPTQILQQKLRNPIKIIPLFPHPLNPSGCNPVEFFPALAPRQVYLEVSEVVRDMSLNI